MSKFFKEIEIKFKVDDNITSNLKNIAFETHEEKDEYYFTKELVDSNVFLRFRHKKGKVILNLKVITRSDNETNDCYEADEMEIVFNQEQYEKMKKIFNVMFPVKIQVNKTRSIGKYNDCELFHDKVENLGNFLEIEGPREKILEICKEFNIDIEKRDREKGYAKMTLRREGFI